MNFDVSESTTEPPPATIVVNPFIEAIMNVKKASSQDADLNHCLQKTLGTPLDALYGSETSNPSLRTRVQKYQHEIEDGDEIPDFIQGEVARLKSHFKVSLDASQPSSLSPNTSLSFVCQLDDPYLPAVPPIVVDIPSGYPETSPSLSDPDLTDYCSTPFLVKVQEAFSARLRKMPHRFTLSQLLNTWEMSLKSACSPLSNHANIVSHETVAMAL
jgi:mediator of RNA polymerase II transcription subunit 15